MAYGPLSDWLTKLFPVAVRYSGISMAFNAGGIIGGAFTPGIAQTLVDRHMGNSWAHSGDCGCGDAVGDPLGAQALFEGVGGLWPPAG
jgi:hypothetical protein